MGIFSSFKSSSNQIPVPWQQLESMENLDLINEASQDKLQVLFKHSTRCSISSMAMSRLEREWDLEEGTCDIHYLDLIAYRPISNEIANRFNVFHESPQMILVKKGEVVGHSSHNQISVQQIKDAL